MASGMPNPLLRTLSLTSAAVLLSWAAAEVLYDPHILLCKLCISSPWSLLAVVKVMRLPSGFWQQTLVY